MGEITVIIDTNMLFIPFTFKIDIFAELDRVLSKSYDIVVLDGTIKELENLVFKASTAKERQNAKMALQLVEMKRKALKIESVSAEYVDDQIVQFASAWEGQLFVATQDLELRNRLKALKRGIGFIILRQKQYLVVER